MGHHRQSIFAFALGTIGVDGRARKIEIEEMIIHDIGLALGVDKDDGARRRKRK